MPYTARSTQSTGHLVTAAEYNESVTNEVFFGSIKRGNTAINSLSDGANLNDPDYVSAVTAVSATTSYNFTSGFTPRWVFIEFSDTSPMVQRFYLTVTLNSGATISNSIAYWTGSFISIYLDANITRYTFGAYTSGYIQVSAWK